MKNRLINLHKKLLFNVPSTTPLLKTYAIVDSMRDKKVKEKIPQSGLNYLDLWHEDLWEFELEVPLYLVELEEENALTDYLLENRDKNLATYLISPYQLEALQYYYRYFTYPEFSQETFEKYGRKEKAPPGKVWDRKVYFGAFYADTLPMLISSLYSQEKIDEFFIGAAMWLIPDTNSKTIYLAFRDKTGDVDDVNLELEDLLEVESAMLNFDNASLPNISSLDSYAHEIKLDLKQMQIFEQHKKRDFIDNVFYWAKEEGYDFPENSGKNRQRAIKLFEQANTLGLESEKAVYLYIVHAFLVNRPIYELVIYQKLTYAKDEKEKIQLLTQEIWRIIKFQRRAHGKTKTL